MQLSPDVRDWFATAHTAGLVTNSELEYIFSDKISHGELHNFAVEVDRRRQQVPRYRAMMQTRMHGHYLQPKDYTGTPAKVLFLKLN